MARAKSQTAPVTAGIPPGGSAPIYGGYAPLLPVGRGTDLNSAHSYTKPVDPAWGPNDDTSTIRKPGDPLAKRDDGTAPPQHFPPRNLYSGSLNRQKSLEHIDMMPVPISGPTTEVVRPVQQSNYTLPSPRWTAHSAPPVYRYIREFGQRFNNPNLPGYLQNDGSHFSMAARYGSGWVKGKARPMGRNTVIPRNVPTPLDDSVVNTAQNSVRGAVFNSYQNQNFMP